MPNCNPLGNYVGDAGLAYNGSDMTSHNPDAPDGRQVAFLQNAGYMFQTRTVTAGTYALNFYAAQREGNTVDQQVRVNLRPSGAGTSVKRFVWCDNRICEERDSGGGNVTKRFFTEGEQRIGGSDAGNYYYSRDHLGSIREITVSGGYLKARYDYDPYGKSVVVDGNMNVDFGYTGHYFHAPSGLNLTLHRAYNPALGRWISRDPSGEDGGINLYGYVGNNPINSWDPLGLCSEKPWWEELEEGRYYGTGYGEDALAYYAQIATDPDAPWYATGPATVGGLLSALWTPDTYQATGWTLIGGYGLRNAGTVWTLRDGSAARTVIDYGDIIRVEKHMLGREAAERAARWHVDALNEIIHHWPWKL